MFNKKLKQRVAALEEKNAELLKKIEYLGETIVSDRKKIEQFAEQDTKVKERLNEINELLKDYEDFSIEKAMAKKANQPWAGLSVSDVEEDGRVALKLDWNEEFIKHLRRSGIQGQSDDDIMAIWFASLVKEWGEEIDEETAEKIKGTRQIP